MGQPKKTESALKNMRSAAVNLSEMLECTVREIRRLQKQKEKELGRKYESVEELSKSYDTKSMKELTAILKDVAAVEKALNENSAEQEAATTTGVIILPQIDI